jgi:indole-3-glycerol phosphate synthase
VCSSDLQLADKIPNQFVKVSESGIENPATIIELKKFGFEGFLMGQNFMQHSRPEKACRDFITELKRLEK